MRIYLSKKACRLEPAAYVAARDSEASVPAAWMRPRGYLARGKSLQLQGPPGSGPSAVTSWADLWSLDVGCRLGSHGATAHRAGPAGE